jgi:hypothetical protein
LTLLELYSLAADTKRELKCESLQRLILVILRITVEVNVICPGDLESLTLFADLACLEDLIENMSISFHACTSNSYLFRQDLELVMYIMSSLCLS